MNKYPKYKLEFCSSYSFLNHVPIRREFLENVRLESDSKV